MGKSINYMNYHRIIGFALTMAVCGIFAAEVRSDAGDDEAALQLLISKYTEAIDTADTAIAAEVWLASPEISFISPAVHLHGWEEVSGVYAFFGAGYSDRRLTTSNVSIHVYGDSAWSEFNWDFHARQVSDGTTVDNSGVETQIYRRLETGRWVLVHVHYSAIPVAP